MSLNFSHPELSRSKCLLFTELDFINSKFDIVLKKNLLCKSLKIIDNHRLLYVQCTLAPSAVGSRLSSCQSQKERECMWIGSALSAGHIQIYHSQTFVWVMASPIQNSNLCNFLLHRFVCATWNVFCTDTRM